FGRSLSLKRNLALTTALMALMTLLCFSQPALAQFQRQHCSDIRVAGTYGLTTTGSLVGVGPVAATGLVTFDGRGNLSGSQTRSVNGDVADEILQGTYNVNFDCMLTTVVQVFESGQLVRTSTLQGVIEDNGKSIIAIFTKVELPDGTLLP